MNGSTPGLCRKLGCVIEIPIEKGGKNMRKAILLIAIAFLAFMVVSAPASAALGQCGGWIVNTDQERYNPSEIVAVSYNHVCGDPIYPGIDGDPLYCMYLPPIEGYFWVYDENGVFVARSHIVDGLRYDYPLDRIWDWDQHYTDVDGTPDTNKVGPGEYTIHFGDDTGPWYDRELPAVIQIAGGPPETPPGCDHGKAAEHNPHC